MDVEKKVKEAGLILGALGVIGFIGIVWLMIYGNLDGNLGYTQDTNVTSLQELTIANNSVITLNGGIGKTNPATSNLLMINATGGETITSGNYTVTGTTITGSATMTLAYNGTAVNISYTTSYDSSGKIASDGVITNLTGGFGTFFGFSNTFFTIAAIVLLIFMLVGLLAIVMMIAEGRKKKKETGYSGY